jgi:predicted  nucleic acid-binding Zn-ribbon protein
VNSHEECQRRNLEGQDERQNLIDRFIETEKKLSDFSARLQSAIAEKKAIAVELRQAREEIAGLRNKISEVTESLHRREVELAALNASFKFSAEVSQEEVPVHHQS